MSAPPPVKEISLYGLSAHPQRAAVASELHARPFERIRFPASVSHLAMIGTDPAADRQHVTGLCERFEQTPPGPEATHHSVELGAFRLRWERHTEFSTYTVFVSSPAPGPAAPFAGKALDHVPGDWLATLPGQLVAAVHMVLEYGPHAERAGSEMIELFGTENVAGSRVADGGALIFTDFRLHPDGFGRILVQIRDLTPRRLGRLVQRILEIETYRLMALLAFPIARSTSAALTGMETALQRLTERMTHRSDLEDEQRLLSELSELASRLEDVTASNSFRLSAARAYHALIDHRIDSLREQRLPDLQTVSEFMERRFSPAMRTCASVSERQDTLAIRLSRATELLRTRVDVALERQNRDLLASMNRRTDLQLRLQQTVEGLSVVVLTYYSAGLVAYVSKGLASAGVAIDSTKVVAVSVPLIAIAVFGGLRLMRRRIEQRSETHD